MASRVSSLPLFSVVVVCGFVENSVLVVVDGGGVSKHVNCDFLNDDEMRVLQDRGRAVLPPLMEGDFGVTKPSTEEDLSMAAMATSVADERDTMML